MKKKSMTENHKINVLCVEDNLAVVDYISTLLDQAKYSLETINDGQKALDFLLTTTMPPDIILLDYILPSLDGIKILQALKANKKKYTVVFLTADESLETAVTAIKEGAIDYLAKSSYLKTELNIKIEKAYQFHQERLKTEYYEEQLALLSLAVEQSPNSFVITDLEGNIEYVNKQFSQYTGYNSSDIIGKNPRILKGGEYPRGFFEKLWKTITSGRTWKGEFVNKKKNGEIFYEKAIISPIINKSGEIVSYLGIKEDITELKKTEQALNKVTEEMNHFFTVALDLLCIVDNVTQKFLRLNKAWEDTLGYTIDELINKPYLDFVHPDDLELTRKASMKLTKSGRLINFVNRYRCKDGSYKFIEWSSITNSDGTFYSSAHDITQRKLNELALKESELHFRTIFETANAGIFFCDKNGQFIMVNKALQNMLGYSLQDLYQMDFSQLTHSDDLIVENEKITGLIINEYDHFRIEKRYVSKTGEIIWVDLALAVMREEDKGPYYYVGVVNDISEQKQYETQLKERNFIKDKFFSIIAHDLRSQFSVIRGFSELLTTKDKLTEPERQKIIDSLHASSQNGLTLLEDLLEWSRSQLNKVEFMPEKLSLSALVDNVLLVVRNQAVLKQIEIVININHNHHVIVDKRMMNTVLRNLLENAIKFTPIGGQIMISATIKKNNNIISVKDNGVGMPKDIIEKLFRIDHKHSTQGTEKEKGTGLGLILVREFIEKHGGNISVESELDKGSEFIISIPERPFIEMSKAADVK